MSCLFTHGETTDLLQVFFKDLVSDDIRAGQPVKFTVSGVRGPPSTSAVSGFSFQTTSADGDIIDRSAPDAPISLQVTLAATGSALGTEVTSSDPSINMESYLTVKVANLNPLPALSNIKITIPDDFNVSGVTSVTTLGSSLDPEPEWTFDAATASVDVKKVNTVALQSQDFIYVVIGPVVNPAVRAPTATFSYLITDD